MEVHLGVSVGEATAIGVTLSDGRKAATHSLIAAVPDPQHPGQATPMTAQHAVRQGRLAADNTSPSSRGGTPCRVPSRTTPCSAICTPPHW